MRPWVRIPNTPATLFFNLYYWKDENKRKISRDWPIFRKNKTWLSFRLLFHYLFSAMIMFCSAGSLVWWQWEDIRVLKVVGSNPSAVHWMGIFSYICCKNFNVTLKRRNKRKRGREWTILILSPIWAPKFDYGSNPNRALMKFLLPMPTIKLDFTVIQPRSN